MSNFVVVMAAIIGLLRFATYVYQNEGQEAAKVSLWMILPMHWNL